VARSAIFSARKKKNRPIRAFFGTFRRLQPKVSGSRPFPRPPSCSPHRNGQSYVGLNVRESCLDGERRPGKRENGRRKSRPISGHFRHGKWHNFGSAANWSTYRSKCVDGVCAQIQYFHSPYLGKKKCVWETGHGPEWPGEPNPAAAANRGFCRITLRRRALSTCPIRRSCSACRGGQSHVFRFWGFFFLEGFCGRSKNWAAAIWADFGH
jgi:hypothetical protein